MTPTSTRVLAARFFDRAVRKATHACQCALYETKAGPPRLSDCTGRLPLFSKRCTRRPARMPALAPHLFRCRALCIQPRECCLPAEMGERHTRENSQNCQAALAKIIASEPSHVGCPDRAPDSREHGQPCTPVPCHNATSTRLPLCSTLVSLSRCLEPD